MILFQPLLVLFCTLLCSSTALKILVYSPTISKSHMLSNGRIADTLAADGHNVTIVEAEFMIPANSIKTTKLSNKVVLSGWDASDSDTRMKSFFSNIFKPDPSIYDALTNDRYKMMGDFVRRNCKVMLEKHSKFWENLKSEEFDIFIAEQFDLCAPGLRHLMGAKSFIWVSSCPLVEYMTGILGIPITPSFVPAVFSEYPNLTDKMTMYQRLRNIIDVYNGKRMLELSEEEADILFQKHYGPTFPKMIDILHNVSLVFVLADEFLAFPRPVLHNVIYIGGGGIDNANTELEEPYVSEMQKGKKGVVFFSMGSVMKTKFMPLTMRKNLIAAFSQFPDYHFIVKVDEDDPDITPLAENIQNIKLVHWAPQPGILAHDRLKLFITHGGYNSLMEVIYAAKPVITLPMFGDQWTNAYVAQRNGFGRVFDKRLLVESPDEFRDLLKTTLENEQSLHNQALRIRNLIQTKPMGATERLLAYTKFVGENREFPELHVEGRKLSTIVYYNLDIIAFLLAGVTLLLLSLIVTVVFIIRRFVLPLLGIGAKEKEA